MKEEKLIMSKPKIPKEKDLPEGMIVECPKTEQKQMTTGGWRILRSVIDQDKCTHCLVCWISCPDGAISVDESGDMKINLKYCKGCGICAANCPVGAIGRVPELDFDEVTVYRELPY